MSKNNNKIKGRNSNGKFVSKKEVQVTTSIEDTFNSVWYKLEQLREEIYSGYFDQDKITDLYNQLNAPDDTNIRRMKVYILSVDKQEVLNNLKNIEV